MLLPLPPQAWDTGGVSGGVAWGGMSTGWGVGRCEHHAQVPRNATERGLSLLLGWTLGLSFLICKVGIHNCVAPVCRDRAWGETVILAPQSLCWEIFRNDSNFGESSTPGLRTHFLAV